MSASGRCMPTRGVDDVMRTMEPMQVTEEIRWIASKLP